MLKAENRLRHHRDIDRVYKKGSYGAGEGYISVKATHGGSATRAVVVVSKKVDKRAVVRNTIRRRLLGNLATIWATVPPGYDIVISVHRDTRPLDTAAQLRILTTALTRAHVISH